MEHGRAKIKHVGVDEEASFLCVRCETPGGCLVCHQDKLPGGVQEEEGSANEGTGDKNRDAKDVDGDVEMKEDREEEDEMLRFRCVRCKQEAHYQHRK